MLKGSRFECKKHLNQLRPRHIKDVMQKDSAELPMEVIYDAFEISVPIHPPESIEISQTQPLPEVPVPLKLLMPQIPPAQKLVKRSGRRKSNDYVSTSKRGGIEQNFHGKISSGGGVVMEYP